MVIGCKKTGDELPEHKRKFPMKKNITISKGKWLVFQAHHFFRDYFFRFLLGFFKDCKQFARKHPRIPKLQPPTNPSECQRPSDLLLKPVKLAGVKKKPTNFEDCTFGGKIEWDLTNGPLSKVLYRDII